MIQNQIKSLKPISLDAQFKYKCTNSDCESEHWLFLNQVQVKGFKLVCDCGNVYRIRQIENLKMQYSRKIKKTQKMSNVSPETVVEIQPEHLKKAYKILETYGFSNKEAIEMIDKVYSTNKCDNPLLLVKDALKIFGGM
jgi:alpha-D-ribose 1-methylphosphonate 5-phosphate C-P lyase